jgi:hypothetical protein
MLCRSRSDSRGGPTRHSRSRTAGLRPAEARAWESARALESGQVPVPALDRAPVPGLAPVLGRAQAPEPVPGPAPVPGLARGSALDWAPHFLVDRQFRRRSAGRRLAPTCPL